jgi:hypothetical protein
MTNRGEVLYDSHQQIDEKAVASTQQVTLGLQNGVRGFQFFDKLVRRWESVLMDPHRLSAVSLCSRLYRSVGQ